MDQLWQFLFAGGLGGLIVAVVQALEKRSASKREDQKTKAAVAIDDTRRQQLEQELTERVLSLSRGELDKMQGKVDELEEKLDKANKVIDELKQDVKQRDETIMQLQDAVRRRDLLVDSLQRQLTELVNAQSRSRSGL